MKANMQMIDWKTKDIRGALVMEKQKKGSQSKFVCMSITPTRLDQVSGSLDAAAAFMANFGPLVFTARKKIRPFFLMDNFLIEKSLHTIEDGVNCSHALCQKQRQFWWTVLWFVSGVGKIEGFGFNSHF